MLDKLDLSLSLFERGCKLIHPRICEFFLKGQIEGVHGKFYFCVICLCCVRTYK